MMKSHIKRVYPRAFVKEIIVPGNMTSREPAGNPSLIFSFLSMED